MVVLIVLNARIVPFGIIIFVLILIVLIQTKALKTKTDKNKVFDLILDGLKLRPY